VSEIQSPQSVTLICGTGLPRFFTAGHCQYVQFETEAEARTWADLYRDFRASTSARADWNLDVSPALDENDTWLVRRQEPCCLTGRN
jgi:hypothetical protein